MLRDQNSRRLVDPELLPMLGALPSFGGLSNSTLAGFRISLEAKVPAIPDTNDVAVDRILIRGLNQAPDIVAILYRPAGSERPGAALLNLHGGGYVMGSADREDAAMRSLATDADCAILSINYRLAPETPYPGPLDDCWAALQWLHEKAPELGIAAERIGVRGVSAGGGLAAALSLRARDAQSYPVAFAMLIYPMLDDRTEPQPNTDHFVWTADANRFAWKAYLGKHSASPPHYAAPARAPDLAGLPPTFIATGSIDLFASENLEWARRLIEVGVPVELHVYLGAYHGFPIVAESNVAQRFERDCRSAIARALHRTV